MNGLAQDPLGPPTTHWGASEAQIRSAPCQDIHAADRSTIEAWIRSRDQNSIVSLEKVVRGIRFKNQTEWKLKRFEQLTPRKSLFSSSCESVECALKEIFGESEGFDLLYILDRFGFNASHLANDSKAAWSHEELSIFIEAFSTFPATAIPPPLKPTQPYQPMTHSTRLLGKEPGDSSLSEDERKAILSKPGILAIAGFHFTNRWNAYSPEIRKYAIVHEVGHIYAQNLNLIGKNWEALSGGFYRDGKKSALNPEKCVSKYATTDPDEDFAESTATYRFNGIELKLRSPEKYEIIKKNVFRGVEYLSEEGCKS